MHQSSIPFLTLSAAAWAVSAQPPTQNPLQPPSLHTKSLEIPSIGLGLRNSFEQDATNAVTHAFNASYHHFDSAAINSNEQYVGRGLHDPSSPSRETYWLTSKLWNTMHKPENVPKAFAQTLADLNTSYLDLYLVHYPVAFLPSEPDRTIVDTDTTLEQTWLAMEKLVADDPSSPTPGTTRYIGIANFSPRQIDQVLAVCSVCPYAHEFETHPYLQQQAFVNWHHEHNITVIAYSPLANLNPAYDGVHGEIPSILTDEYWKRVAAEKKVTVAQVVLGWGVARATVIVPKSVNSDHIKENIGAGEVMFSQAELDDVAQQDKKARFDNPSQEWGVDLFEGLDDGFSP